MAGRRILYLSAHELTAYRWQAGEVCADGSFADSAAGLTAFADYLRAQPKVPCTLLANLAEEAFHAETIPCLRAGDRRALIARKLAQRFPATDYACAVSLGRERNRRQNERLLLAALTAPAALAPWLAILRDLQAPLAGVCSLPFAGAVLLEKLRLGGEPCLLLTVQDRSLRESYCVRGRLRFSRLLPLAQAGDDLAETLATEAAKLRQYLLGQRLLAPDEPLRAVVVVHPQLAGAVAARCINGGGLRFEILDSDDCARRIGLKTPPTDSRLDLAHVHLIATAPPAAQFAPPSLRHDWRVQQARRALHGCGAAALAAALLFAGGRALEAHALKQATTTSLAAAHDARERYAAIARTFPPLPASPDVLRRIVGQHAELARGDATPAGFYRDLGTVLAAMPAIAIDEIAWTAGDGGAQTLRLRGRVELGPHATPRQQLAALRRFIAALDANPALRTAVDQEPVAAGPGQTLRGDATGIDGTAHPFALQIVRRSSP